MSFILKVSHLYMRLRYADWAGQGLRAGKVLEEHGRRQRYLLA